MNSVVVPKHLLKVNARKSCSKPLYKHGELIGSGFSHNLKSPGYYSCRSPNNIQTQLILANGVYKENVQETEHVYWNHHDFNSRILQNLGKQMENSDIDVENVAAIYDEKPDMCSKLTTLQKAKDRTTESLKWCHDGKNQKYFSSTYKNICRRNGKDGQVSIQGKTGGHFSPTENQQFLPNAITEPEFCYNRVMDALRPVYSNNYSQDIDVKSNSSKYITYKSKPSLNEGTFQKDKTNFKLYCKSGRKIPHSETNKERKKKCIYSNKCKNSTQNTRNFILYMRNSALKGVSNSSRLHPKKHFSKFPHTKTKHVKAGFSTNKSLNSVSAFSQPSKNVLTLTDQNFIPEQQNFTTEISKLKDCDQNKELLKIPVLHSVSEGSAPLDDIKTEDSGYKLVLSDTESEASVKTVKQEMPPLLIPLSPAAEEIDTIEILPASPQMPTLIPFTSENEVPPFEGSSSSEPCQSQNFGSEVPENSFKSNKKIQSQFWYEKFASTENTKENNTSKLPFTYYPWTNFGNASAKIALTKRSKQIFPHLTKYLALLSPPHSTSSSDLADKNSWFIDEKLNGNMKPWVVLEKLKDSKLPSSINNWQYTCTIEEDLEGISECDGSEIDIAFNKIEVSEIKLEKDPEFDLIDGQEFFSFLSEKDMEKFSEKHGHSFSFYSELSNFDDFDYFEAQLLQEQKDKGIIVPRKTNDITLIKGWRNKLFFNETAQTVKQENLEDHILSFSTEIKYNSPLDNAYNYESDTGIKIDLTKDIKSEPVLPVKDNLEYATEKNRQLEVFEEKAKNKNTRSAFMSDVLDSFLNHSELRINLLEKYNPNITPLPKNSPVLSIESLKTKQKRIWNSKNYFENYLASQQKSLEIDLTESETSNHNLITEENNPDIFTDPDSSHSIEEKSLSNLYSVKRKVNENIDVNNKKHKFELPKSPDVTQERLVLKLKKETASGENEAYKVTNIYSCNSPIDVEGGVNNDSKAADLLKKEIKVSIKNFSHITQNSGNMKKLKKDNLVPFQDDPKSIIIREICTSSSDIEKRLEEFFKQWKKEAVDKLEKLNKGHSCKKFICPIISESFARNIAATVSSYDEVGNKCGSLDQKDSNSESYEYELFADDYSYLDPSFISTPSEDDLEKHQKLLGENISVTYGSTSDKGNAQVSRSKRSIRLPARYMDSAMLVAGSEWVSPNISPKDPINKKQKRKLENEEFNTNFSNVSFPSDDNSSDNKSLKKTGLLDESSDCQEDNPLIIDEDEYNNYYLYHSEECSPNESSSDKKLLNKLKFQQQHDENLSAIRGSRLRSRKEKPISTSSSPTKSSSTLKNESPINFDELSSESVIKSRVQCKPTIVPLKPSSCDNSIKNTDLKSEVQNLSEKNPLSIHLDETDSLYSVLDKGGETITLYSADDDDLNNEPVLSAEKNLKDIAKCKSVQLNDNYLKENEQIKFENSSDQKANETKDETIGSTNSTNPLCFNVRVGDKVVPLVILPSPLSNFEMKSKPETDSSLNAPHTTCTNYESKITNKNDLETKDAISENIYLNKSDILKKSLLTKMTVKSILKQVKSNDSNVNDEMLKVKNLGPFTLNSSSDSKFNGTTTKFSFSTKTSASDVPEKTPHQILASDPPVDRIQKKPYAFSVNNNSLEFSRKRAFSENSPNHHNVDYLFKSSETSRNLELNVKSMNSSETLQENNHITTFKTENCAKKQSPSLCTVLPKPSYLLESIVETSSSPSLCNTEVELNSESFQHGSDSNWNKHNNSFFTKKSELHNSISFQNLPSSSRNQNEKIDSDKSENTLNRQIIQSKKIIDTSNGAKWTHYKDISKITESSSPKIDENANLSSLRSVENHIRDKDFKSKAFYTTTAPDKKFTSLHELATQLNSEELENRNSKCELFENGYSSDSDDDDDNDLDSSRCSTGNVVGKKVRDRVTEERQRRMHEKLLFNLLKLTTKASKKNVSQEAILKTAVENIHTMENKGAHLQTVVNRLVSYRRLLLNRYKQLVEDLPIETQKKNIFDLVKRVKRAQMRSYERSETKTGTNETDSNPTNCDETNVCASSKVPKSSSASSILSNAKISSDADKKEVAAAACKMFGPCVVRRVRLKNGRIAYAYKPIVEKSPVSDGVEHIDQKNCNEKCRHARDKNPYLSQPSQINSGSQKSVVHSDSLIRTDDLKDPPKLSYTSSLNTSTLCSSPVKIQREADSPLVNNSSCAENTSVWISGSGEPCYVTQLSSDENTEDEQTISSNVHNIAEIPTIVSCSTISEEEFLRPSEERTANNIAG